MHETAEHAGEDGLNQPLGARRWERVYVRLYDAFVQGGRFSNNVELLLGVLCQKKKRDC